LLSPSWLRLSVYLLRACGLAEELPAGADPLNDRFCSRFFFLVVGFDCLGK